MRTTIHRAVSVSLACASLILTTATLNLAHAAGCQTLSSDSLQARASAYKPLIQNAANQHGVSSSLVKAVITVESCFRPKARGSLGEKGLMQLMPATARRFNIRNGYNAQQNIHGGTRYLGYLQQRYGGDLRRMVAAYNAGEGRIKPGGRIPNTAYVSKVMQAYSKFSGKNASAGVSVKQPIALKTSAKSSTTLVGHGLPWADLQRDTYQVKAGDTVYEAMRQTGVPVKQLVRLNNLPAPYTIKAGQVLQLN
ncbi:MAG: hypothetical protein BWK73_07975 [Thiothrix lacustris]|uniref:LysM domain-containing protein n=1 Tax=Thiothrix lacustris TaxID=525917 RepID=A0A1Y1QVW6_9GAMM|nr:MAG: hypothetical protein BWK73_07975 [Thiothrix lacustris]